MRKSESFRVTELEICGFSVIGAYALLGTMEIWEEVSMTEKMWNIFQSLKRKDVAENATLLCKKVQQDFVRKYILKRKLRWKRPKRKKGKKCHDRK